MSILFFFKFNILVEVNKKVVDSNFQLDLSFFNYNLILLHIFKSYNYYFSKPALFFKNKNMIFKSCYYTRHIKFFKNSRKITLNIITKSRSNYKSDFYSKKLYNYISNDLSISDWFELIKRISSNKLFKKNYTLEFNSCKFLFYVYFSFFLKKLEYSKLLFKPLVFKHVTYDQKILYMNFFKKLIKFRRIFGYKKLKVISKTIFYSLILKDSVLLARCLQWGMQRAPFKKHKRIIRFYKKIISYLFFIFNKHYGLKGVYFLINGKIGVGGDSKTRGWTFRFGSLKLSSKTRKCSYSMFRVKTKTGVLGAKLVISYE